MKQHDQAGIATVSYLAGYAVDVSLYQHFLVVNATCKRA